MESESTGWYIVKRPSGHCDILEANGSEGSGAGSESTEVAPAAEKWGPFETQNQAIARRVGLIRAGKCQPN